MNKTMPILYRDLAEEEIMERLDGHNVTYVWRCEGGQYKDYYLW